MHKVSTLATLLVFNIVIIHAQPGDYYVPAEGLAGEELKSALHQLIDNHMLFSYTSSNTDVWDILKQTDMDPENPDNVIMLYTGRSVDAAQEYNSGNGWTREHVWPQSRGDFGTNQGVGTDVHHIRPLENGVNSVRSNRSFANCNSCVEVIFEGVFTGSYYDNVEYSFEPREEVKGDVARMIFYMALRYEGTNGELDLELTNSIPIQGDILPLHGKLDDLMEWNAHDPVDDFEMNRNNIIHANYQGNRNPFIDHPELADHLWGDLINENWPFISVSTRDVLVKSKDRFYPNPTRGDIRYTGTYARLEIFNQTGLLLREFSDTEKIDLRDLSPGVYICRIYRPDGRINMERLIKL